MSVPTPETTSIMVTESVSTRKAQGVCNAPMPIQSANCTTAPSGCALRDRYCSTEIAKAPPEAATAMSDETRSPRRRPTARLSSSPTTGKKMIQGTRLNASTLALQAAHLVDIDTLLGAKDGYNDSQAPRHFGCSHGDDEEHVNLPA